MSRKSVRVAVTGAAGQIGYALCFRIAAGEMFGPDTDVHLNLLELEPALSAAEGVRMELDDCAFPCLKSITPTADAAVAFKDCDWALLIGAVPRKKGMERGDLLNINAGVFTAQGKAIGENAKSTCKVLVVGNPCNTNALIAGNAGKLPRENVFAMTMLDENRALTQIAQKAGVDVTSVENLNIWGNHSPTMYPRLSQRHHRWQATDVGDHRQRLARRRVPLHRSATGCGHHRRARFVLRSLCCQCRH